MLFLQKICYTVIEDDDMKNKKIIYLVFTLLFLAVAAFGTYYSENYSNNNDIDEVSYAVSDIPKYDGQSYIILNNNEPEFNYDYSNLTEEYSTLDSLGRCGVAIANVSLDTMPTEKRGSIGMIKPSGWHTVKYDNISGKYLYNRCHLIGYQLTGENANPENLITCTRQMNADTMLEFENKVADYVKKTGGHVLYRVTPVFEGDNLVATGVQMEAKSVEDNGEAIKFNVFVYNVQDGISIDYATGDSKLIK